MTQNSIRGHDTYFQAFLANAETGILWQQPQLLVMDLGCRFPSWRASSNPPAEQAFQSSYEFFGAQRPAVSLSLSQCDKGILTILHKKLSKIWYPLKDRADSDQRVVRTGKMCTHNGPRPVLSLCHQPCSHRIQTDVANRGYEMPFIHSDRDEPGDGREVYQTLGWRQHHEPK